MADHNHRPHLLTANTILAVVTLLAAGPAQAGSQDGEAIETRLEQYETRFNAGNPEALARLFAEDVVYYGPLGNTFEGRDPVEERYRHSIEAGFSDMGVEVLEIRVLGETAYDVARYTIMGPAGEPPTGHHLAILEKRDGEWIVRRTLVNAKMPAPPVQ